MIFWKKKKNGSWISTQLHVFVVNARDRTRARTRTGLLIMHHFQYPGSHLQTNWSTGLKITHSLTTTSSISIPLLITSFTDSFFWWVWNRIKVFEKVSSGPCGWAGTKGFWIGCSINLPPSSVFRWIFNSVFNIHTLPLARFLVDLKWTNSSLILDCGGFCSIE